MSDKEMRELDAWIAEHVMGWKETSVHVSGLGLGVAPNDPLRDRFSQFPYFTANKAAAMEVLEKLMTERTIAIENYGYPPTVFQFVDGAERHVTHGDTLPLAICLFAKQLFSKEQP